MNITSRFFCLRRDRGRKTQARFQSPISLIHSYIREPIMRRFLLTLLSALLLSTAAHAGELTLSTTSITLGSVPLGQAVCSSPRLTITNSGLTTLTISMVTSSDEFGVCGGSGSCNLVPGATCGVGFSFFPKVIGVRTGTLTISSNAVDSPQTVSLSGTGVAPFPVSSLKPTSLVFALLAVGNGSVGQVIQLTNNGSASLILSSIQTSGDFSQINNCGTELSVQGSCSISVTFTPTAGGTRSGSVSVVSNATGSPQTITLTGAAVAPTLLLDLSQGWNLLGNGIDQTISVASLFGDPIAVTTVWKWDTANLGWQFYAPSMDASALQTYATGKGYGVLSVINPGEGFWVNANQSFTKPLPSGTVVTAISFQDGKSGALKQGWNLISIGNSRTPSGFNGDMSASPPSGGVIPINITTLWAWDNPLSKWYFYAPNLDAQGGSVLTDYITSKGYLDFTANGKTLGPGTGFWVNKP